jgi:hypothetical protein
VQIAGRLNAAEDAFFHAMFDTMLP